MITRRKKKEMQSGTQSAVSDSDVMEYFKSSEDKCNGLLSPWEPYIMTLQSFLVWENPQHTAILLVVVNILFWLATTLRFYYLVGLVGFFGVFLDMWWARIWPEIRVPPPLGEDQEGWTPVHPQLLSVPELSHYCARFWVTSTSSVHWVITLRRKSHAKFFVLMSGIFVSLAFFGSRISGILLCYITVMSFLVIPPLIYHNILHEVFAKIEPYIFKFEKTFNIKRKKRTRKDYLTLLMLGSQLAYLARIVVKKKSGLEDSTISVTSHCSDSEEEIINEFVPSPHPSLLSTLSKAAGRDSDGDHTPSRLTPDKISRGPSREQSDNESHDDNLNFSQDLSEIPSYDDTHIDDSIGDPGSLASLRTIPDYDDLDREFKNEPDPDLDLDETLTTDIRYTRSEAMDFKETHFKESSESGGDEGPVDVDHLAEGLESMPDVEEVLDHEQQESESNRATIFGQAQAMIASDVMTHTVSNLMTSTMTGLSRLSETMRAAASGTGTSTEQSGRAVHYSSGSSEANVKMGHNKGRLTESVDSDALLAEFEFLEEEDLDVMEVDNDKKMKRE